MWVENKTFFATLDRLYNMDPLCIKIYRYKITVEDNVM